MIQFVFHSIDSNPAILFFSGDKIVSCCEGALSNPAVTGTALGVDPELKPVGLRSGQIVQVQTTHNEVASAKSKPGSAGEYGLARDFRLNCNRRRSRALAIKPHIGVFPFSRSEHDGVARLGISHSLAGSFRIRNSASSGMKCRAEQKGGKDDFHDQKEIETGPENTGQIARKALLKMGRRHGAFFKFQSVPPDNTIRNIRDHFLKQKSEMGTGTVVGWGDVFDTVRQRRKLVALFE